MRWLPIVAWVGSLWVAAGVEAVFGDGMPGPLLLVAIAAGIWTGVTGGLVTGAAAGLLGGVISGHGLCWHIAIGMAVGAAASALPRWLAREHLVIAIVGAIIASSLITLVLSLKQGFPMGDALLFALRRSGQNALWMIPIYGIVLIVSPRETMRMALRTRGEQVRR